MPFYDYKCGQCGKTFETSHGMGGKPAGLKCEFCGSIDVQRVFQAVRMMKGGSGPAASSGHSCSSCSSGSCGSCH